MMNRIFKRAKDYPKIDSLVVIYVGVVLFFQILLQIGPAVTFLAKTPLYSIQTYLGLLGGGLILLDVFTTKRIWQGKGWYLLWAILAFAAVASVRMAALGTKENLFKLCWMAIQFLLVYSCAFRIPKEQLENRIRSFFYVLLAIWTLCCCVSFYQYVNQIGYETVVNPLAKDPSINRQGFHGNRLYGIFYTLNHAAYVSLFFVVIAAVFALREKRIWVKISLIAAQVALLVYIVLSGSRSALLALLACAVIAVFLVVRFGLKKGSRWKKASFAAVMVLLIAGCCFAYGEIKSGLAKLPSLWGNDVSQESTLDRTDLDISTSGRIKIWSDYLSLQDEIGLTGLSPGNYMPYVIQEHPKLYIAYNAQYNHPDKYNAGIIYHVHSGYMMVYVSAGLLGAIALAAFMLLCLIRGIYLIWKSKKGDPWFVCALLLVVAGAISAAFDEGLFFQNNPQTTMFWFALGLVMSGRLTEAKTAEIQNT